MMIRADCPFSFSEMLRPAKRCLVATLDDTSEESVLFFGGWVNSVNTYEITICLSIYLHPLTVTRQLYIHYICFQLLLQSYSTIYSHPSTRFSRVPSGCPGLKS